MIGLDGGQVRVAGHDLSRDPDAVRAVIGVTGQFSAVDNLLTGEENLNLMADLRHLGRTEGRRRSATLLEQFDLVEAGRSRYRRTRAACVVASTSAMTLVGDPRIIFLDEPTTGLDPRSRLTMWQIIRDLVADGVTIFLTTQNLEEADQLAGRIAVLDHGKLIARGHARTSSSGASPAAMSVCSSPTSGGSTRPRPVLDGSTRDDETLALEIPGEGDVRSLRTLLADLDRASIEVEDALPPHAGPRRRLPRPDRPARARTRR